MSKKGSKKKIKEAAAAIVDAIDAAVDAPPVVDAIDAPVVKAVVNAIVDAIKAKPKKPLSRRHRKTGAIPNVPGQKPGVVLPKKE